MTDPRFQLHTSSLRLEEHLDFGGLLSYLRYREDQEQVVAVAPVVERSPSLFENPVAAFTGVLGTIDERVESGSRSAQISFGPGEVVLAENAFVSAARFSMGPEVEAVLVETGGLLVLVQDVLTEFDEQGSR